MVSVGCFQVSRCSFALADLDKSGGHGKDIPAGDIEEDRRLRDCTLRRLFSVGFFLCFRGCLSQTLGSSLEAGIRFSIGVGAGTAIGIQSIQH